MGRPDYNRYIQVHGKLPQGLKAPEFSDVEALTKIKDAEIATLKEENEALKVKLAKKVKAGKE